MKRPNRHPAPQPARHLWDEPDIGSGEKTPAQTETEELIRQIPPLPERDRRGKNGSAPPA
ncbi:hypothetical protein [Janthinobacterium fluminis]|uniref:Uncharacterized protein n=1 Tax=Janthinobacterium fluminis TaxID=2987524 RepID=A0ABT5JU68_9BURK|nr:hypothetical protein [Janthinobacterium fluminis]MDC8756184.1 hypothetical protein [Janthinobacterium fluminis]